MVLGPTALKQCTTVEQAIHYMSAAGPTFKIRCVSRVSSRGNRWEVRRLVLPPPASEPLSCWSAWRKLEQACRDTLASLGRMGSGRQSMGTLL
jgi:hypothetical protein